MMCYEKTGIIFEVSTPELAIVTGHFLKQESSADQCNPLAILVFLYGNHPTDHELVISQF